MNFTVFFGFSINKNGVRLCRKVVSLASFQPGSVESREKIDQPIRAFSSILIGINKNPRFRISSFPKKTKMIFYFFGFLIIFPFLIYLTVIGTILLYLGKSEPQYKSITTFFQRFSTDV